MLGHVPVGMLAMAMWVSGVEPSLAWPAQAPPIRAGLSGQAMTAASLCRSAIAAAETGRRVPDGFLAAIARVESGRADPATGALAAWPWTVNAEGAGSFYATQAEAVTAVRELQARGVRSIDVGCMQVNLMHHPEAFTSLEQAFDPAANAAFAAGFLVSLFGQMGSWPLAAAAYHSQTPTLGSAYQKRVLAEWAVPADNNRARPPGSGHAQTQGAGRLAPMLPALAPARLAMVQTVRPAAIAAFGRVGAMNVQPVQAAHLPMGTGRNLAAYRLLPTQLAVRLGRSSG